ncbi:GGDEF domain-containing protein [Geoalkalibacter subterraneus]|uniref:GGDEF domain-containing protein n=1 Tax=Geoalkalibacter subterraneus TaxID=483547 RepID=UPI000694DF14|nr:GGDEF domain-containing protein [Geoalkalibacter subterraneus]
MAILADLLIAIGSGLFLSTLILLFFFGVIFVLVICYLSARITKDISRLCRLEHEVITNPLTGADNRRYVRYMDVCLRQEAAKIRRYNLHLSVLLIDADHFKKINDTYGHLVGDQVLKNIAQTVKGSVRDFDLVFRYGGEELLVLLPYTNAQGAKILAERLRQWISDRPMLSEGQDHRHHDIRLTVSIGASSFLHTLEDEAQMVERADRALYLLKKSGRNTVTYMDKAVKRIA